LGSERDSSEAGAPEQLQEVFSKHAVRRPPRELQQALKKKQLQKQDETNWEDDERYGWD
jgi:microcompartment protein CcmL/EutN